jgi:hypothetical protein
VVKVVPKILSRILDGWAFVPPVPLRVEKLGIAPAQPPAGATSLGARVVDGGLPQGIRPRLLGRRAEALIESPHPPRTGVAFGNDNEVSVVRHRQG